MDVKPRTLGQSGNLALRPCSPVEKPVTWEVFVKRPRQAAVLVPDLIETFTSAASPHLNAFQRQTTFLERWIGEVLQPQRKAWFSYVPSPPVLCLKNNLATGETQL